MTSTEICQTQGTPFILFNFETWSYYAALGGLKLPDSLCVASLGLGLALCASEHSWMPLFCPLQVKVLLISRPGLFGDTRA